MLSEYPLASMLGYDAVAAPSNDGRDKWIVIGDPYPEGEPGWVPPPHSGDRRMLPGVSDFLSMDVTFGTKPRIREFGAGLLCVTRVVPSTLS